MVYEPAFVLTYEEKPVALRIHQVDGDTSWYIDVSFSALNIPNLKLSKLKSVELQEGIIDGNKVLATPSEFSRNIINSDVSENIELVDRIRKSLTCDFNTEQMGKVAYKVFDSILNFRVNTDGFIVKSKKVSYGKRVYEIYSTLHTTIPFLWNRDRIYCEYHYDVYSIIEDCKLFNAWCEFGRAMGNKYSEKTGLGIKVKQSGTKDKIYCTVRVTNNSLV